MGGCFLIRKNNEKEDNNMLFFLNGDGTMTRADSGRIFQGSNNVTEIQVVSPFAGATALSAAFTLPNGIETVFSPMQYGGEYVVKLQDGTEKHTGLYYNSLRLPRSVTQIEGTVKITVNAVSVYDGIGEDGAPVTAQNNCTSYSAAFNVEFAALPQNIVPDPTPDETKQIIDLLELYYNQNAYLIGEFNKDITDLQNNKQDKADNSLETPDKTVVGAINGLYNDLTGEGGIDARLTEAEADIDDLQTRMKTAEENIEEQDERLKVVEEKTAKPLMTDFTTNVEEGTATKYYNDGTSQTIPLPSGGGGGGGRRLNFLNIFDFTADNWVKQADDTYQLMLTSEQTGRTNNRYVASLEFKSGSNEKQLADCVIKGSDGSILVEGVTAPYAGRLLTLASGGAGTDWHDGTLLTGQGEVVNADEELRAASEVGDIYFNTETDDLYRCTKVTDTESTWEWIANIRGLRGVSVTAVSGGESAVEGDYTVTPITFTFDEGEPVTLEVKALNGKVGVLSLNGMTGNVVINKDTVGLGEVDNTSDADKPVSKAQAAAIADAKEAGQTAQNQIAAHIADKANPHAVTAAQTGAEPAFTKNTAFNKNFGTEAGTVCEGDDERLTNARPADGGNADTVDGKHASDFATAAQGVKADSAYQKPSAGIPKSDLAAGVQTSLGKADTAYQKPSGGIPETDLTEEVRSDLDKADTAYQKPADGIPETDLAADVRTSLSKADTALQSVPDATASVKGIALLGATGGAARYGQKADVGLSNVDNTADLNKPVSTAMQAALDGKVGKSGSQSITGDLTIVKNGSNTGNMVVQGDLTVEGTTVTKEQESLIVADNIIVTNSNATPLTDLSGLVIRTDATKNYGIVYDPVGDAVKLGEGTLDENNEFTFDAGEGEPVAVRDDDGKLVNGNLVQWDSTGRKLVDGGAKPTKLPNPAALTIGTETYDGTAAKTVTPALIGAEPAFSKNTAFNKNFGTEAGTVCQGNDSRLTNARPANGGNADTVDNKHAADFATSAQGAKADSAYQKPSGGIPESDLAAGVQTSLGKADSAYQLPEGGIPEGDLAGAVKTLLSKAGTAYQKPGTGIPSSDMASAVQSALNNANSAYQKPSGGIPKTDLASAVQTSLGKADSAYQKPSTGIPAADLAAAVQTSLGKADSALQSVPNATTTVKGVATLGASGGAARYGNAADVGLGTAKADIAAAQETADNAASAAATAQSKATAAQNTANAAQSKANTSVQYAAQTLTAEQQAQARANIGAAAASGSGFKAVAFTASSWAAQSDGTYTLTLTAAQTGRTNNQYIATIEKSDGTDFIQLADAVIKAADGSLRVQGVTAAYAGRVVIITV